jgi:DNA polymerase I
MTHLILDANNLLYRTFWVNKSINPTGEDASVMMFLRAVKSYCDKFNATRVYAVWDKKLTHPSTNFRKTTSDGDYKGNRDSNIAKEAHQHQDIIKTMTEHLGIKNMYPNVMEADDVIAYLTYELTGKKYIVSVDKDLYQLINKTTYVYSPIQKITITPDNFKIYTKGIDIESFVAYKALIGDNSDNIKGLPKVGHKRAMNLVEKFKVDEPKNILTDTQYEIFMTNVNIMNLSTGYKFYKDEEPIYKYQVSRPFPEKNLDKFFECCAEHGMHNILHNKDRWLSSFAANDCLNNFVHTLNN